MELRASLFNSVMSNSRGHIINSVVTVTVYVLNYDDTVKFGKQITYVPQTGYTYTCEHNMGFLLTSFGYQSNCHNDKKCN